MRILYSCLFYIALPLVIVRLLWRSLKAPAYRARMDERLGFYRQLQPPSAPVIWVHAVSVGEAEAVFPLIKQLQQRFAQHQFLMTTTTPTGSARVLAVMGADVLHVYLPYDVPAAIQRFMAYFQPVAAIMVETEIWPNLFAACERQQLPLYIINARLSEKSLRGYSRLSGWMCQILRPVTLVAAQTEADAQRFRQLGVASERVAVLGNIKFDIPVMDEVLAQGQRLRQELFQGRFVWVIASTHKGEEQIFLQLWAQLKCIAPDLLLVFVPRHPERFPEVRQLCRQHGLTVQMRTEVAELTDEQRTQLPEVFIVDTLGELKMFYAAADLAFVGGSLVPVGGHNILEAAAAGVPILFGPYMSNFKLIAEGILTLQGARQCQDAAALLQEFESLYANPALRNELHTQATVFVARNRGAMQRVLQVLEQGLLASEII